MTNQNYLCIQRSPRGEDCGKPSSPPSPTQMEEMYAKFNAWKEKFKDNIVDMGGRLSGDGKIVTADGATDGPFVEVKEVAGGYMIISTESIEQAIEIAQGIPGLMPGTTIEVRPISTP